MELIIISDNKLKIMLTAPDMAHYELESARLNCADAHTRAAFRHIFDDARDRTGFDTEGERLFIQFYASREGGCEIFVTKLGDSAVSFQAEASVSSPAEPPILAVSASEMSDGERELLRRVYQDDISIQNEGCSVLSYENREEGYASMEYSKTEKSLSKDGERTAALFFIDMRDLLTVCHRLLRDGYRGRSTVYIDDRCGENHWYLLLEIPDVAIYRLPRKFAFLAEYGQEVDIPGLIPYLVEYGHLIRRDDAVDVLGYL